MLTRPGRHAKVRHQKRSLGLSQADQTCVVAVTRAAPALAPYDPIKVALGPPSRFHCVLTLRV